MHLYSKIGAPEVNSNIIEAYLQFSINSQTTVFRLWVQAPKSAIMRYVELILCDYGSLYISLVLFKVSLTFFNSRRSIFLTLLENLKNHNHLHISVYAFRFTITQNKLYVFYLIYVKVIKKQNKKNPSTFEKHAWLSVLWFISPMCCI